MNVLHYYYYLRANITGNICGILHKKQSNVSNDNQNSRKRMAGMFFVLFVWYVCLLVWIVVVVGVGFFVICVGVFVNSALNTLCQWLSM